MPMLDSKDVDAATDLLSPATDLPSKDILSATRPRRLHGARSEAQLYVQTAQLNPFQLTDCLLD